jgi:YHS domain-containing protein
MIRRILFAVGIFLFILGINKLSFATGCHGGSAKEEGAHKHSSHEEKVKATAKTTQETKEKAINVGNKICPVSGEKIDSSGMKAVIYEYQGKIYNFCCSMCVEEFKKNPEEYIKKIEKELSESGEGTPIKIEEDTHQGHQH